VNVIQLISQIEVIASLINICRSYVTAKSVKRREVCALEKKNINKVSLKKRPEVEASRKKQSLIHLAA
jgi:hypothetical protein